MHATVSHIETVTHILVTDDKGVLVKKMTLEEAHQFLEDGVDSQCTDDCAAGRCVWCLVFDATEGIR